MQFVMAVMNRWPGAVLQFEDFNLEHAEPLLQVSHTFAPCVPQCMASFKDAHLRLWQSCLPDYFARTALSQK